MCIESLQCRRHYEIFTWIKLLYCLICMLIWLTDIQKYISNIIFAFILFLTTCESQLQLSTWWDVEPQGSQTSGCTCGVVLVRSTMEERPAHCRWHYSLSYDPVLNKMENEKWAQMFIFFLSVDTMSPAALGSAPFASSACGTFPRNPGLKSPFLCKLFLLGCFITEIGKKLRY